MEIDLFLSPIVQEAINEFRAAENGSTAPKDPAHGFHHSLRVARLTLKLRDLENPQNDDRFSDEAGILSAVFHDWVNVPKNSPMRSKAAELSAEKAKEWLRKRSYPEQGIQEIADAIMDHSYSSGRVPRTLLGKCLQDADRLEALGTIGLFRMISIGTQMGAAFFDEEDPWAKHRDLADHQFMVDHCFVKLLLLPQKFQTQAGRVFANKRKDTILEFLKNLGEELGAPFEEK